MANYYHTSREHVKNLKAMQDNAARRAERRTELASIQAEHPLNALRVDARPVKIFRNTEQYRAIESMEGMLPWNGDSSNMIDRFDGRALLDFYREPVKRSHTPSDEEMQLDELVALDSFRDLIKLLQKGLDDSAGIRAAELENIELRAEAKTQAAAAAGVPFSTTKPSSTTEEAMYGAVEFTYDTGQPGADQESEGEEESSDESDIEDAPQMGDTELDHLASNMGIEGYSSLLRRVELQESEFAAGNVKRAKRMFSRKKAAQRAKRMAGMGLEAFPKESIKLNPESALITATRNRVQKARDLQRRSSPSYHRYKSRSRSRSRSVSPGRAPKMEYITSFSDIPESKSSRSQKHRHSHATERSDRNEGYVDALPDRVDPSVDGGPVSLPETAIVMRGRRVGGRDFHERQRAREDERDYKRRRSPENPPPPKPKDQGAKETPIERLKRLRAAQLNKTFQKEMLTNTEKKAREERDRAARLQIEKAAYSRRPRSPSPNSRLSEFSLHDLSPRRRKKFVAVELTGINIQLSSCFGRMKQKLAGLQKQAYRSELCFRISDQVCIVRLHSAVLIEVLTPTHSS